MNGGASGSFGRVTVLFLFNHGPELDVDVLEDLHNCRFQELVVLASVGIESEHCGFGREGKGGAGAFDRDLVAQLCDGSVVVSCAFKNVSVSLVLFGSEFGGQHTSQRGQRGVALAHGVAEEALCLVFERVEFNVAGR